MTAFRSGPTGTQGQNKVRCAIYTRKSTEDGLEQDFNSLDAQREACEAYIASQKHEGWVLLAKPYDDGGISGGHLDRPGVQALLADVDAGLVDQIVVYKVDRLTRSLTDFSKLVDRLDAAGASFVSVTQSFNTATSMGRLTLNMLLSFAQFEREVTAERIRDKIAASKARGLWMGGNIPFGYNKDGRTLRINEEEAQIIRKLFQDFAEGQKVGDIAENLRRKGIRTRARVNANGKQTGGKPFARGHLYEILSNPIYIGKIRHKHKVHDGRHEALISDDLWERVQRRLDKNNQGQRTGNSYRRSNLPLLGKLLCALGAPFVASHSRRKGRRYDYYVRNPKVCHGKAETSLRYSAAMLEGTIGQAVAAYLPPYLAGTDLAGRSNPECSENLCPQTPSTWNPYIKSITIEPGQIQIQFEDWLANAGSLELPFTLRRQNKEQRIIVPGTQSSIDETIVKNLAYGRFLYRQLKAGVSLTATSQALAIKESWAKKLLGYAFINPRIVDAATSGTLPAWATAQWFAKQNWPMDFQSQNELIDQSR